MTKYKNIYHKEGFNRFEMGGVKKKTLSSTKNTGQQPGDGV